MGCQYRYGKYDTSDVVESTDMKMKAVKEKYRQEVKSVLQEFHQNPHLYFESTISPLYKHKQFTELGKLLDRSHSATNQLDMYSPKYLRILQNLMDENHVGLHVLYSQFRTLEGIGIFRIVLNYYGYTEFRIKKEDESYQIDEPSVVTRGHFKDEVWGLAVGVRNFYVTSGDDGYVRVWNRHENVQSTCFRLGKLGLKAPVMARACALSTSFGECRLLAVGLGGMVGRGKTKHDGKLVIFKMKKDGDKRRELEPMIGDVNKKLPPLHRT